MGQTARTSKLLLDLSATRRRGGVNTHKRSFLEDTVKVLDAARRFYLAFFLAHPDNLLERVQVISTRTGEVKDALVSADKPLSLSRNVRRWKLMLILVLILSGTSVTRFPTSPIGIAVR